MSHFLQRIAAGARKPGGTVHPLLGSVYTRSVGEPVAAEESVEDAHTAIANRARGASLFNEDLDADLPAARRAARTGIGPAEAVHAQAGSQSEIASARASASASASALLAEPGTGGSFNPLMPVQHGAGADSLEIPGARSAGPPSAGPLSAGPPSAGPRSEARRYEGALPTDDSGLRRGDSPPRDLSDAPIVKPMQSTQPFLSARAAQSSRHAGDEGGAPQQPDDIQIHIGRIEVTAAQPPVQPQAPAAPRRPTPSLDEFLKRRGARR